MIKAALGKCRNSLSRIMWVVKGVQYFDQSLFLGVSSFEYNKNESSYLHFHSETFDST